MAGMLRRTTLWLNYGSSSSELILLSRMTGTMEVLSTEVEGPLGGKVNVLVLLC